MTTAARVGPSPVGGGPAPYLTAREVQILRLAANGNTNRSIGRRLATYEFTIKATLRGILRKLHVQNRTQAVAVSIRLGLISTADVNLPDGLDDARSPHTHRRHP